MKEALTGEPSSIQTQFKAPMCVNFCAAKRFPSSCLYKCTWQNERKQDNFVSKS